MKYVRAWPVLLALLGGTPAARAQFLPLPSPYGAGYSGGAWGIGFSRHGRHTHLSAFVTGGGGYYTSYYGYPYYPVVPSRVTIVQVVPPPTIVVAPPAGLAVASAPARPRAEEVEPPQEKPPGDGRFRPVRPPVPPVPPVPKAPEVPPAKPPAPPKEKPKEPAPPPRPPMPRPPQPEADPRAEGARQSGIGLDAFGAGEYGRAAQRFRQAVLADPTNARAHFLLAQAEVALGKYDEAVEAIQAGLRLDPDWPTAPFRPVTLYGDNVTDLPEHLRRLESALERHPDDAVLLFLYAYELWFDGRRDEARPLFQRAAAADKTFSERFLLARPDQPAL